jgi:hypothetical protein
MPTVGHRRVACIGTWATDVRLVVIEGGPHATPWRKTSPCI